MPGARSSSARKPDSRARLIKAATEVVARQGFHAASVDAIARRAGYSIGALYWNFASKDELFFAVFDEHVSWFERHLREAVSAPDPGRGAAEWLELLARRPEQLLIFVEFWAYAVRKPTVRKTFADRMRLMREAAARALRERADEAGERPAIPPEFGALIGLAVGRGLAMEQLADPDAVDSEAVAELVAALTS